MFIKLKNMIDKKLFLLATGIFTVSVISNIVGDSLENHVKERQWKQAALYFSGGVVLTYALFKLFKMKG